MSTPKVPFSDLEDAFQNSSYEHSHWLRQAEMLEEWTREEGVEIDSERHP